TQSNAILGTPAYMAPEQAACSKELTAAADVYRLGAILYHLLTGRPPFQGDAPLDVIFQVLEREPERPRKLARNVNRGLESICLKCLQKDPRRRYPSAEALAADLDRWLDGKPIQARRSGLVERGVKWVGRNLALTGLIGVSLALGVRIVA